MSTHSRRFVFVDYENLKKIKFKKLEKVCQKIFVFVSATEDQVPLSLVLQMQRLGRNIKWIMVPDVPNKKVNYHIAFVMGKIY